MSMRLGRLIQFCICGASITLIAACSSTPGGVGASVSDLTSTFTKGLGKRASFAGQESGEMYTAKAPHNQVYLFAFDNSQVAGKYLPSIEAQANYLKRHPNARVMLAGNTDERGSREYNVALGERRANSVADLFKMAGVARKQVRVVSYGEERPVAFGHDEASFRKNRRVELTYEATR
jgi:peptidoglycan-associated lipoprotein